MARRIKEDPTVHQNRIAQKAEELFSAKGIDNTSMDEIDKRAGYSKATLYVYFKNKEDIVSFLALKSMSILRDILMTSLNDQKNSKEAFFSLCYALVDYQNQYPDFFDRTLNYIQFDVDEEADRLLNQTYRIGEEINHILMQYLESGIEKGELGACENYFETIFHMWGMISGLIKLAKEKETYIKLAVNIPKDKFLEDGFQKIYKMICNAQ